MNISVLNQLLETEQSFRLKQIKKAFFLDLIDNWNQVTTLPKYLREKLNVNCPLDIQAKIFGSFSSESQKILLNLIDNLKVEAVLMRHGAGRNTVCVSSQVGCQLACSFCATGQMGFKRNLKAPEIIEQVLFFARLLKKENKKVTNVVFMGMGEPFLNYQEVIEAIKILNDKDGFNLGARHISVSTVGIPDKIRAFADLKLQVNLALSLHGANDQKRSSLIPLNKKYSLKEVMPAIDYYIKKTHRQVMIEYLMIRGVNDAPVDAHDLVSLLRTRLLCLVNLISYNPTGIFQKSQPEVIKKFKHILLTNRIKVTERYRFGDDINAACGQLAGK